jgi:hypothetical protein
MINLHDAIYALNPSVVTIRGNIAYDKNEQVVSYDKSAAQAKLVELQAAETAAEQAQVAAKQSALDKLTKLGLAEDEIKALVG